MNSPLAVVVLRLGDVLESEGYTHALRDIFVGSEAGGGTSFGPKELLQAGEFREVSVPGDMVGRLEPLAFLHVADRVLAIILDTRAGSEPKAGQSTDAERSMLDMIPAAVQQRTVVLNVILKHAGSLYDSASDASQVTRLGLEDLEERDLRMPFLTLYALHHGLRLFGTPAPGEPAKAARLFLSHAKRDGVPLTKAFRGFMSGLKGFDAYYDTEDLDLNGDIDLQLSTAVASAVVIVFRSDVFDQRYWCQKEVLWAEQHGRPVVTVDARWQIEHGPSLISFDSTPVVRIPDGNVVRICAAALMEALRVELFTERARAHASAINVLQHNIPRCPSLVSLHNACVCLRQDRAKSEESSSLDAYVVYPNPALPATLSAAAAGLAQFAVERCRVLSLDEFRLLS
jgi:hypothetical protein